MNDLLEQFKNAETDVKAAEITTGKRYETEVLATFETRLTAKTWKIRLIERFRRMYGVDKLPGNEMEGR